MCHIVSDRGLTLFSRELLLTVGNRLAASLEDRSMALVIVSAGTLASSRMRTMTMRTLAIVAGALTFAGLLGGLALGFQLGSASYAAVGRAPEYANLDPEQPGSRALIDEIGSLSGRMIQLEAEAGRLTQRIGRKPPPVAVTADTPANTADQPAGGPLLAFPLGSGSGPEGPKKHT